MPAPLPSTVTQTSIPMSADVVGTVVEILVSVKSPVTSDGRMFKVTPLPFDVEMLELKTVVVVPPDRVPPSPILHDAPVPVALKLPLLCVNACAAPKIVINATTAISDAILFIE